MMETPPEGLLSELPKELVDKFIGNNRSPLIQLNVPQLSRLNAQNGAFLWDMGGILKRQLFFGCIGTRLVFQHTLNEKNIFAEDKGRLFPLQNQLESELMRAIKERTRIDGLPEYIGTINSAVLEKECVMKNGLFSDIVDNAKGTVFFSFPDFFTPSFKEYEWTHQIASESKYYNKKIDMTNFLECHLPFNVNGVLFLVQHILKSISDDSLTDLLIMFHKDNVLYAIRDGDEEVLIDIVITLNGQVQGFVGHM